MVDDAEFMKRRHLSRGRPRKYDPSPGTRRPGGVDAINKVTLVDLISYSVRLFPKPSIEFEPLRQCCRNGDVTLP